MWFTGLNLEFLILSDLGLLQDISLANKVTSKVRVRVIIMCHNHDVTQVGNEMFARKQPSSESTKDP